jgi:hypothetical protein
MRSPFPPPVSSKGADRLADQVIAPSWFRSVLAVGKRREMPVRKIGRREDEYDAQVIANASMRRLGEAQLRINVFERLPLRLQGMDY